MRQYRAQVGIAQPVQRPCQHIMVSRGPCGQRRIEPARDGTRLGITEEQRTIRPDAPDAVAFTIYDWLTYLQGELVEQLLG